MSPRTLRILVADDEPAVRLSLGRAIACQADMTLIGEAADGASAVRLIQELTPDVVIMDITMPGTTGLEAVEQLRSAGDLTPVVFLTGDPAAARLARLVESSDVLIKARHGVRDTIAAVRRAGAA